MARPATSTSRLLAGSREPVRVATTANINPAAGGLLTIDGVTVEPGDRVLVKDQTDKRLNGIYGASAGEWYRASDARSPRAINKGVTVHIAEGTVHEGQTFAFLTPEPEIGIDEIVIGFFLSYDTVGDAETEIEGIVEDATSAIEEIADEAIAEVEQASAAAIAEIVQEGNEQVDRVEAAGAAITGIVSPIIIAENTFGTKGSLELWNPETPPDYVRIAGYYTAGDGGGALYKKVDAEPAHQGKIQSADGAWWEIVIEGGEMTFEQFGGRGDGDRTTLVGTDNFAAWQRALSVYSVASNQAGADSVLIVPRLKFQIGIYYFGQTLDIRHCVHLVGRSSGDFTRFGGTKFTFPPNTTAIRLQNTNTSGATGPIVAATTGAGGSIIEGITLQQSGTDKTAHGFHLRVTATLRNCFSTLCPGNAFHVVGHVGHATLEGNCNNFLIDHCEAHDFKGNGLWIEGKDTNGGRNISFTTQGVAGLTIGAGIVDLSTYGCTHITPQITGYGNCGVHRAGIWYALISHTAGIGGATEPGTNDNIWYPYVLAAVSPTRYPEWVSGGDYFIQLPIYGNGPSTFIGPYCETGLPAHVGDGIIIAGTAGRTNLSSSLAQGGTLPAPLMTKRGIGAQRNFLPGTTGYTANGAAVVFAIGTPVGADENQFNLWEHRRLSDGDASYEFKYSGGDLIYNFANSKPLWHISTASTTVTYGRVTPVPHMISFSDHAFRDPGNSNNWRIHGIRDAAPVSGEHARGEIMWGANPVAGGKIGWVCVTSGTPGTWKPFGAIDA